MWNFEKIPELSLAMVTEGLSNGWTPTLLVNNFRKKIMVFRIIEGLNSNRLSLSDDGTIQFPVHIRYLNLAMNLTLSRLNLKCQEYTVLVPSDDCSVSLQHFILLKILDSMFYS